MVQAHRACANFPTPVSAGPHCRQNVPPGNIKLMEDPEDPASLLETTTFDSGQVVCSFQKVSVPSDKLNFFIMNIFVVYRHVTLDKQVHGRLEDQGGLVDDLLSQMWKITQLCQKGVGGLVDDMLEPIDSGQKDLRWLLSQQTCGIPDVQEFLPSTTCVWGQDSYPDQKVNVASTKIQA